MINHAQNFYYNNSALINSKEIIIGPIQLIYTSCEDFTAPEVETYYVYNLQIRWLDINDQVAKEIVLKSVYTACLSILSFGVSADEYELIEKEIEELTNRQFQQLELNRTKDLYNYLLEEFSIA